MPYLLIAQIVLLVLWFTVAPTLPALVVFLPVICAGVLLVILALIALLAAIAVVR